MYTETEKIFAYISLFMLLFTTSPEWLYSIRKSKKFEKSFSHKSMVIAFACTTALMITRWIDSKHLPLSNLYESLIFISWSSSLIYLIFALKDRDGWSSTVTASGATLIHGFATSGLPGEMERQTRLIPALQSHWLAMHVSMMSLSYATLLRGSLLAVSLSIIYSSYKKERSVLAFNCNTTNLISTWRIAQTFTKPIGTKNGAVKESFFHLFLNLGKYRLVNRLDQWIYQIISLGFSLLTIGILSGAVWANEAWGSYWSWDPKETWALVTRLIYATYIHARMTNGWRGQITAAIASMGFFLVWIRFLGVNLLGIGLHNYGWLV
uniref:Cytochrome c biogenesis protein CcsA n=1 Tax=Lygodium japonicum TaxID=13824 RepID=S4UEP2_LYGJA|nr:heme attachment to plastid cytochrome c [Lygodium japonicum]AGI51379.1 heme attachment to plastid cytochrome c [Lygodium japonicum]